MSSLQVFEEPKVMTDGAWTIAIESNQDISGGISSGYTTSNEKTLSHSDTISITESFGEDFEFESDEVSTTLSHTTGRSVTHIVQENQTRSCQASCDNPKHEPVALWQWQTTTHNLQDTDQAMVDTCFYVCRYGINTQSPPKCPAGACKDGPCN